MAYKQSNNPISRKTSPLHTHKPGHFPTLDEKFTATENEMKENAKILTDKVKAGESSNDEQTYAGGEVGRDYNEEGLDSTSVTLTKNIKKKPVKKVPYHPLGL